MRNPGIKIFSFILSVSMVITFFPALVLNAATIASGKCGANITWSLDDKGTLTISGSGEMEDYDWNEETELPDTPWVEYINAIKAVVISGNVTSIGTEAFDSCKNLKSVSIPNSVTTIGDYSFEYCYALTSITIPDSVTDIYPYAFCGCENLKSIKLSSKLTGINEGVFQYCDSLESITLPNGLKTIGFGSFNSSGLSSVNFPDSVTVIEDYAFSGCDFTNLELPKNITEIKYGSFSDCMNLQKITIPEKVTSIGPFAFGNNVELKSVSIPLSVKSIDPEAFSGCEVLTDVYYSGTKNQFYKISGYETLLEYFNVHYSVTPLKITSQPADYTGIPGSNAVFKVAAQGSGLKYQWQTLKSGNWVNSSLPGSKTDTLSVEALETRDGYKFRCVVKDSINQTVVSNEAVLHVSAIVISVQPKDFSGQVGSTAKFKVTVQGTGLKYQWQSYKDGKWVNSSLTGAKTATLSVPVTETRNGYKFRCVITDANNNKVISKKATLHVIVPVTITTQPKSYTGPVGSTAKFTVKAAGTGLKYQWQTYKNGKWVNSTLTGSNTATLSVAVTAARDGYKFRCVVTDSGNNTATSKTVTLNVAAPVPLAIITQPYNIMGPVGATAKYKIVAQGTGLKYQWQTYKNGKWVNSTLPGSTTAELSVEITRSRDGYKFRCVITDAGGNTVTSNAVLLKVKT